MENTENNNLINFTWFFSKYAYKQDSLVNKEIIFEGLVKDCDNGLLEDVKVNTKHKYVRIWKKL